MPAPIKDRLLKRRRIDETTGCWLWPGSKTKNGYGRIGVRQRTVLVHRLSASVYLGFDIDSIYLQVNHKPICPNRHCFNPDHLYIGTQANNLKDKSDLITHCPKGHEYTSSNIYRRKDRNSKECKLCQWINGRRRETKQDG